MSSPQEEDTRSPLQILMERVERDREQRCREILQAARSEAEEIRQEAYSRARRRVHRTVQNQRQRVAQRLRSAQAERGTRLRQQRHQRINAALKEAWDLLEKALRKRWAEAEGREEWVRGALEQAERFLPAGTWTLEHPSSLDPQELSGELSNLIGSDQVSLDPKAHPHLGVGVRIRCGDAEVDATPEGLLVDRERVRSWLLAEAQKHREEENG